MLIRLGYEIGSGAAVDVPLDHTAVTGRTQQSGKTTTLEALVHRSGRRAVVFVTKKAESGFRDAVPIPPYFEDSADWQFVSSILEAMLGEKMKFERSWIIDACKGARGLDDVYANISRALHGESETVRVGKKTKTTWKKKPATGLNAGMLTNLAAYLEIVLPQVHKLPYADTLVLGRGLNVMDLSGYSTELQSLVIRSVLKWVYERERDTVVIIPEAWEFIPQNRRSPVLLAAEELIRKGAASGNFVWLDSQDIAAVHKNVLRSVGVWILGVQREANEIKRMLLHIPRPAPSATDVMTLGRGQFFASFKTEMHKVYVQPFWVGDVHAQAIARGEEKVESAERIWRETASERKSREETQAPAAVADSRIESEESRAAAGRGAESDGRSVETGRASGDYSVAQSIRSEAGKEAQESEEEMANTIAEELGQLRRENELLRQMLVQNGIAVPDAAAATRVKATPPATNGHAEKVAIQGFTDIGYEALKRHLMADPGVLAQLARVIPAIEVQIDRPVVEMNTTGDKGRIALLIHEGFFAKPRRTDEIVAEFRRRGWMETTGRPRPVNVLLSGFANMGFLTIEESGYHAVPGMKISTRER